MLARRHEKMQRKKVLARERDKVLARRRDEELARELDRHVRCARAVTSIAPGEGHGQGRSRPRSWSCFLQALLLLSLLLRG